MYNVIFGPVASSINRNDKNFIQNKTKVERKENDEFLKSKIQKKGNQYLNTYQTRKKKMSNEEEDNNTPSVKDIKSIKKYSSKISNVINSS